MPEAVIRRFRDKDGDVPLKAWMDHLEKKEPRSYRRCLAAILELNRKGFVLQRPTVGVLGDGIFELRWKVGRVNFRIAFFWYKNQAVLSHGFTKEGKVPPEEIALAKTNRALVESNPTKHLEQWELDAMSQRHDFADEIRRKLANDPALAKDVADERANLRIAEQIYSAREAAGLTQAQLAKLANTSQSVIARVEDADYDGHSTKLVQRIASALGLAVRVELYDPSMSVAAEHIIETSRQTAQIVWSESAVQNDWQNLAMTLPEGIKAIDKCVAA